MRALFRSKSAFGNPPIWLWIYVAVSIVRTGVAMGFHGVSAVGLAFLPFSLRFLWLLLRGGRVVWCLLAVGEALPVVGVAWGESVWWAAVAVPGLALLFAPASLRYVWKEAPLRRSLPAASDEAHGWTARIGSGVLWEEMWTWVGLHVVNWGFIGRLAMAVFTAFAVSGALRGARHDGLLTVVAWRIAHVIGGLGLILLLGLLVAAGIRALTRRIQPGTKEIS